MQPVCKYTNRSQKCTTHTRTCTPLSGGDYTLAPDKPDFYLYFKKKEKKKHNNNNNNKRYYSFSDTFSSDRDLSHRMERKLMFNNVSCRL